MRTCKMMSLFVAVCKAKSDLKFFYLGEFDILAEIPSYAGVSVQPENFPPLTINARTALFILKRRQLL
jgi:hypothetical protein